MEIASRAVAATTGKKGHISDAKKLVEVSWIAADVGIRQIAPMNDLNGKSIAEMLALHAAINEELRSRNVLRSANNPTGDLAEYLFCAAFGWEQEANSKKGFDAADSDGVRYQIKGRRLHRRNKSRQMSAIRSTDGFDILAGVLFNDDFCVIRAALIPASVVFERTSFVDYTKSHKFYLRDDVWDAPGVSDVTERLRAVEQA
ncbi:hypothetical protein D9M73_62750 [compost metagenome]|jgi:hypothetical protein